MTHPVVPSPKEILIRACAINPDPEAVAHWYTSVPLPTFDGRTAKELVEQEGRGRDVMDYIEHLASGPLG